MGRGGGGTFPGGVNEGLVEGEGGGFEVLSFSLYLTIVVQSNVPQSTDKDLCIV